VPGSPSAAAAGAAAPQGELPPSHPPLELPAEAVTFLQELTQAAEAAPEDVDAWQKLARARYRAALIDPTYAEPAKAALGRVLELDANNLEAIRTSGNLAYDTRDYPTAETYFERYLALDPDEASVKTDLASTLLFQGERDRAKVLYREVIAKSPDFVQAHLNLGIALHADGDREGSKAALRTALASAKSPEQKAQVERVIALAEQRTAPSASMGGAKAAAALTTSNATTDFQRDAESVLRGHSIVGPKIVAFEWSGPSTAKVALKEFPMQAMPPVMRNKFKSRINEELAALAARHGVSEPLRIELTDAATSERMDALDGKEWVGAFDEGEAQ
jgi:tetratricopeptide (TPR) repeat protein